MRKEKQPESSRNFACFKERNRKVTKGVCNGELVITLDLWMLWAWKSWPCMTTEAHQWSLLPNVCPAGAVIPAEETPHSCFAPYRCVYIPCRVEYACQRINFGLLAAELSCTPQVSPLLKPSWFSSLESLKLSRERHPWTKCPESSCKGSIDCTCGLGINCSA